MWNKQLKELSMWYYNRNIKFKLTLYFLVLILLSFLLIGVVNIIILSKSFEDSANQRAFLAISQANTSVDNLIRGMENAIDIISSNEHVVNFLEKHNLEDDNRLLEKKAFDFLESYSKHYFEISGLAIVNEEGTFVSNSMERKVNKLITTEEWYQQCINKPESIHIFQSMLGRSLQGNYDAGVNDIITVAKALKTPSGDKVRGAIIIDFRVKVLEDMLEDIRLGKEGFIYIANSAGEPVYSPLRSVVPRVKSQWFIEGNYGVFKKYIQGKQYSFIFTSSFYTKWRIVAVFPMHETLEEINNFKYYSYIVLIIESIIALIISVLFSSSISKPINRLKNLMKKAEKGDLTVRFNSIYDDEVGQLGKSFNVMIYEIKNLIAEVRKEQKSKREAELKVLQAHIKPHFLYNTLDTINWMALKYNAEDIIETINALTKLFRIGLSRGDEIISLSEEIKHVRSYLTIQKQRYEDILDFEIRLGEEMENYLVQKVIIQPIVENAIYHGIKQKGEPGIIIIKAKVVLNKLVITVFDNGVGIHKDKLDRINDILQNGSVERIGYGVFNVNERIRISRGLEYGIKIFSKQGKGTIVKIYNPIVHFTDK